MNKRDFFYRQIVSQSDLDEAFDWVEEADRAQAEDAGLVGVFAGFGCTETAPASLGVLVGGPGVAADKNGARVATTAPSTTVACDVDEYGATTSVANVLNERWISVFVEFDQEATNPAVDGNAVTIQTKLWESARLFVRRAGELVIGTDTKPPLLAGALLLCDIRITFGMTAISNGNIDVTRREDFVRFVGMTLSKVYGTPVQAIVGLLGEIDSLTTGGGIAYTPSQTWADGSALTGTAPPVSNVWEALDAIIHDLAHTAASSGAHRLGVSAHTTTGNYCNITAGPAQHALEDISDAVAGHINGGAPAHPAASVTFTNTNINGHWGLTPTTAQAAIDAVVDALVAQTATAGAARIGNEAFETGLSGETAVAGTLNAQLTEAATWIADRPHAHIASIVSASWDYVGSDHRDLYCDHHERHSIVISDAGGACGPGTTLEDVERGLPFRGTTLAKQWANPRSTCNTLAGITTGHPIVQQCVVTVPQHIEALHEASFLGRVILSLSSQSGDVFVNDGTSLAYLQTFDLTGDLPAGDWHGEAICSLGDSMFAAILRNETPSPNQTHYIQCWTLGYAGGVITCTVNAAWPATGTQLPGTGASLGGSPALANACYVSASAIYTANVWNSTDDGDVVSRIALSTGAVYDSGIGDASVSATRSPTGGLCTDGTNVYFLTYDSATHVLEVCSCVATDPDTGAALSGFPVTTAGSTSNWAVSIVCDGETLFVPRFGGSVLTYDLQAEDSGSITAGSLWAGSLAHAAFDGRNIWMAEFATDRVILWAFDVASVNPGETNTAEWVQARPIYMMNSDEAITTAGRLFFDGSAIHAVLERTLSEPLAGKSRRVSRACSR